MSLQVVESGWTASSWWRSTSPRCTTWPLRSSSSLRRYATRWPIKPCLANHLPCGNHIQIDHKKFLIETTFYNSYNRSQFVEEALPSPQNLQIVLRWKIKKLKYIMHPRQRLCLECTISFQLLLKQDAQQIITTYVFDKEVNIRKLQTEVNMFTIVLYTLNLRRCLNALNYGTERKWSICRFVFLLSSFLFFLSFIIIAFI